MSSNTSSAPPEITAEWTVHAQLTLSHQGGSNVVSCDKVKSDGGRRGESIPVPNSTADGAGASESPQSSQQQHQQRPPVKVIYKFSAPHHGLGSDGGGNYSPAATGDAGGGVTFKQDGSTIFTTTADQTKTATTTSATTAASSSSVQSPGTETCKPHSDGQDTAKPLNLLAAPQTLTATATSPLFPKCTSTCSIVLTADLLPTGVGGAHEPTISVSKFAATNGNVFNTTTADKYTCFPEKSFDGSKIYEAKDVSCQTSDIELSKDKTVQTSGDDLRSLTTRKAAEALMSPAATRREEKYGSLPRKSPLSPANILSPSNTIQSQRSSVKDSSKKKPRTVHIDVYCTGSDAESSSPSSSDESSVRSASSSSASGSRFDTSHLAELKANSNLSHPTVFESEEMKLRHKRAGKHEVPRRMIQQTVVDQSTLSTVGSLKKTESQSRKSVKRSNTKDEINESKQMLFNKILGEPKEAETYANLEYLERDPSDDNVSSNYPFSVHSAKRDVTGSSLSSALASAGLDEVGDLDESANLNRSRTNVTHSDSFEYANSEDRYRIHQMERVWGDQTWKSPSVERKLLEIHNPKYRRHSESDNNLSESDHSFVYDSPSRPNESVHSDSSPSTVKSNSNRAPPSNIVDASKRMLQQALLTANGSSTFPPRILSPVEGYTSEYLALARRFGSLITGKRKPGVHMGPVRNPECQCEHCLRWMRQRESSIRERAMSVDDTPYNIVDMRKKLHLRNQMKL
ncbi:uncharacterized protein LOC134288706 [Aedes albopictus]|uniref:Uncharacterized protein n=1 Tax=Aedes albopictus TaxID=7160 RepID=A0ABM2A6X3_AEDAL